MRALAAAMLLLVATTDFASVEAKAEGDPLAGRLGGTLLSFKERFGQPTTIDSGMGAVFVSGDFGLLAAEFDSRESLYDDADPALIITFGPPRTAGRSGTEPDPGDWSLKTAIRKAKSLLPTDTKLLEPKQIGSNSLIYPCESKALRAAFGKMNQGDCRVAFIMPTDTTVSFATATLTAGAANSAIAATPEASPCDGFTAWAAEASGRLDRAKALLGNVSAIDDTDPEAAEDLRTIASSFDQLASEQRDAITPESGARASYYLISAFSGYAAAVRKAADAVEQHDRATMDTAVKQLGQANDAVDSATTEIERAAGGCGLLVATPAAG